MSYRDLIRRLTVPAAALALSAASVATLAQNGRAPDAPADAAAADPQIEELDELLQQVQTDPGGTTEKQATRAIELGRELGRAYPVSLAIKGYLSHHVKPRPEIVRAAAELAELAGEYRTAVARYRSYLKLAPQGEEASEAAGRLYVLMIDVLGTHADAYAYMRSVNGRFDDHPLARSFDQWFLAQARSRNDITASATKLQSVMARQMPLEMERLYYWDDLNWLMSQVTTAAEDHFAVLPAIGKITPAIRDDNARQKRYDFYAANLRYHAGAAGRDEEKNQAAFGSVVNAGKAYFDAAPTAGTIHDIARVVYGGHSGFDRGRVDALRPRLGEIVAHAFPKLDDGQRDALLGFRYGGRSAGELLGGEGQWLDLVGKDRKYFAASRVTDDLPIAYRFDSHKAYRDAAKVLDGVRSYRAAVVRSAAAGPDIAKMTEHALKNEVWHLDFDQALPLLNELVGAVKRFAGEDGKVDDEAINKARLAFMRDAFATTPAAAFDKSGLKEYVNLAWAYAGEGDAGHKDAIPYFEAVAWVPIPNDRDRNDVWNGVSRNVRNWANKLRDDVRRERREISQEVLDSIDPISQAIDRTRKSNETGDPSKAPNAVTAAVAQALAAVNDRKTKEYNEAALKAYGQVKGKQAPYALALTRWAATNHREVEPLETQLAVLADALPSYDADGDNEHLRHILYQTTRTRRDWSQWGRIDQGDKAKAEQVVNVLAGFLEGQAKKGELWGVAFDEFRRLRQGRNWRELGWGENVADQVIANKVLHKTDYRPNSQHRSATVNYMWMVHAEFPGLKNKYPVDAYFDDMYLAEAADTGYLDYGYFDYGPTDKGKILNAAAEMLQGFERVPFGFGEDGVRYGREEFYDWHAKALGADPGVRDKMLSQIESRWGKTRFDPWAMGIAQVSLVDDLSEAPAREKFFKELGEVVGRAATVPARVGPPSLNALSTIEGKLSDEEIGVMASIFPAAMDSNWSRGWGFEELSRQFLSGLRAKGDWKALALNAPYQWRIAVDTDNGGQQRWLIDFTTELSSNAETPAQRGAALALTSAGLDVVAANLAEDNRTRLAALRNNLIGGLGSVIPVKPSDPRYPIFASQAAWLTGKEQTAWELYLSEQDLVQTMYKDLDPTYMLWLIERSTEAADYANATRLAQLMELWFDQVPEGFDPETRGNLMLAAANVDLAQNRFPEARASFKRIAAAPEFEGTRAKDRAELLVADVDRRTGEYSVAMEQLERLARREDARLQADAQYFMALVQFDQKQYDKALEHLQRVFSRNPEYADGKILEGRIYNETRRYDRARDLEIGLGALQKQIVPGKPLKVSLKDRNLEIVGMLTQVEIRAWSDAGDEEFFLLLPEDEQRTHFRGELATTLDPVSQGDGVLQVLGGGQVHYAFSDRFIEASQTSFKQQDSLTVVSSAELYASSGAILSRDEIIEIQREAPIREQLGMKEQEAANDTPLAARRLGHQVKPGNRINFRVIDPDRSTTAGIDKLTVRIETQSGDRIPAFELTETDSHTGVFEGSVPTDSSQAIAYASDSADGSEPNFAISATEDYPAWQGQPDGNRPKTFSVDLNANIALGEMKIVSDVPGRKLKSFAVQTSFNGEDYTTVGSWPDAYKPWDGSLRAQYVRAPGFSELPNNLKTVQQFMAEGRLTAESPLVTESIQNLDVAWPENIVEAKKLKEGDGGMVFAKYSGAIYMPRRKVRTIQVKPETEDAAVRYYLVVNGNEAQGLTYKASLPAGVHRIEVYAVAKPSTAVKFGVHWDIDEEPWMAPIPADAFSIEKNPEIKEAAYTPPATVEADQSKSNFTIKYAPQTNARVVRLVLNDFETTAPAISKLTLTDAAGERVLPTAEDFLAKRQNQTLEIVPGDRITITYQDPRVPAGGKEVHDARLAATYANGTITAAFGNVVEDPRTGERTTNYVPMRRFEAGDNVYVVINDPDLDVSEKKDVVVYTAEATSGGPVELQAIETSPHSGVFEGRVFPVDKAPTKPSEIQIGDLDVITLGYMDRENTDPGIPWERTAQVERVVWDDPQVRVYEVTSSPIEQAEDAQPGGGNNGDDAVIEDIVPVRRTMLAQRPELPKTSEPTTALIGGPLTVEVLWPFNAKSPKSSVAVFAQSQSGRDAKGGAAQGPFDLSVPGTIQLAAGLSGGGSTPPAPGYGELIVRGDPYAVEPLEDGRFGVSIPYEMADTPAASYAQGRPEDAIRREQPKLAVKGDDTVYIGFRYTDPEGKEHWITQTVELGSDPFFDVMDRQFREPIDGMYVGQTAYLRVIDPSLNATDDKDKVQINLETGNGISKRVELTETFSHSGVFKGLVELTYGKDASALDAAEDTELPVRFGDAVTLAYAPDRIDQPLSHAVEVYKGADGRVLPFTKRFTDPKIAMHTQFTVAEAYFELAKRHRELGEEAAALRGIKQGKKLLEEAIRDYPESETRAQADYLLANLSLETAKDETDEDQAERNYLEAINRFTEIVAKYPDSPYAPKSQYKKAQAFEKMGQIDRASEEYVKLSYRYPDNELVAETIARLGKYFLTKGKLMREAATQQEDKIEAEKIRQQSEDMFTTAAEVFGRLAVRFPDHALADKTTVLSAQCYMQATKFGEAVETFTKVVDKKDADKDLRAEAMYWCGDSYTKLETSESIVEAYRLFKNLTWEYPESKWARYARGRLTEEQFAKIEQ